MVRWIFSNLVFGTLALASFPASFAVEGRKRDCMETLDTTFAASPPKSGRSADVRVSGFIEAQEARRFL